MAALAEVVAGGGLGASLRSVCSCCPCPRYAGSSSEETVPGGRPTAALHTPQTAP